MRSIGQWLHMMPNTVQLAARSGSDEFGAPTFGSDVSYRARLVYIRRMVRNAQGQEVVSNMTVHLATNALVSPQDRVTLSTGDVGSTESWSLTPPILSVGRLPDKAGWHHTVLYL